MKKKTILCIMFITSVSLAFSTLFVGNIIQTQNPVFAAGNNYSVVLDKSSQFEFDEDGKSFIVKGVDTLNHNTIRFIASGIRPLENGFGIMKEDWHDGGGNYYFLSTLDQINGLQSINVVFNRDAGQVLYVEYGNTSSSDINSKSISTSGINVSLSSTANYFKLYSDTGDVSITSITVNYTCAGASDYWPGYLGVQDNGASASIVSYTPIWAGTRAIIFPNEYNGKPITSITSGIFNNCMDINVIAFPTNPEFTTIPESFYTTSARLRRIFIGDNITTIGAGAFVGNQLYTEVFIPASVTTIGSNAFAVGSYNITFRCEATSKPAGWSSNWYSKSAWSSGSATVVWGATK